MCLLQLPIKQTGISLHHLNYWEENKQAVFPKCQTISFCRPLPHRREQRFPNEWPQTVWLEGLGESERPLLDLCVVPALYLWKTKQYSTILTCLTLWLCGLQMLHACSIIQDEMQDLICKLFYIILYSLETAFPFITQMKGHCVLHYTCMIYCNQIQHLP